MHARHAGRAPALAGIKHCNLLEQVPAAPIDATGYDEGLMRDMASKPSARPHQLAGAARRLLGDATVDACGVPACCVVVA